MQAATDRQVISVSTLCGYRVRNRRNEELGTIEELMVSPASGCIAYAVLSFSDKLCAAPWSMFSVRADDKALVLDVEREQLENAPGFDQDDWPDLADESWQLQIHHHFGRQPALT